MGSDGAEASTTFVQEWTKGVVCIGTDFVWVREGMSNCVGTGRVDQKRVVPQVWVSAEAYFHRFCEMHLRVGVHSRIFQLSFRASRMGGLRGW